MFREKQNPTNGNNAVNQQQALKLWSELKQAFARIDLLVPQIIENRAWEPLGYDSFIEAWSAQLGDIDVSKAFLPAVVYAMYDTGATVDEVAYAVHGVGVRTAELIKRQKQNGVPASCATTTVREHQRKPPGARRHLQVDFGPATFQRLEAVAKRIGRPLSEIAREAILDRFEELDVQ